jgi:hypothetical protein
MAILELTKENLIKCGFNNNSIERLLTWDNYEITVGNNLGTFFASNIDNKIYTERDYYTHTYNGNDKPIFPFYDLDLIEEYYDCKLNIYLKKRIDKLGRSFVKDAEQETFKQNELKECENVINHYSNLFRNYPERLENHSATIGKQAYKVWLEREQKREPIDKSELINELLEPKYILGLNEIQISKSYKYFESHFEPLLTYKNYLDCFDETQTPKHPKLINGQNKYFIHFLTMAGANDKIAKERFGIKQFDNTKSRNKTDMKTETVFVNQMKAILNK